MMNINTTFGYWAVVASLAGWKLDRAVQYTRPAYVGKKAVPENLNDLTIGQLMELSTLQDATACIYDICRIVLNMTAKEVNKARAFDVVRFVAFVTKEVERINKIFESTNTKPTPEEERAGIHSLKFGLFGMLDWYAQRMGITDHDAVAAVPWLRVYKCLDMDNKKQLYNKRLQEVYNNEYRRKNRANR